MPYVPLARATLPAIEKHWPGNSSVVAESNKMDLNPILQVRLIRPSPADTTSCAKRSAQSTMRWNHQTARPSTNERYRCLLFSMVDRSELRERTEASWSRTAIERCQDHLEMLTDSA